MTNAVLDCFSVTLKLMRILIPSFHYLLAPDPNFCFHYSTPVNGMPLPRYRSTPSTAFAVTLSTNVPCAFCFVCNQRSRLAASQSLKLGHCAQTRLFRHINTSAPTETKSSPSLQLSHLITAVCELWSERDKKKGEL